MGISAKLLAWFIDYLKDKHPWVMIRGRQSEIEKNAGVPQGSVLGSLLLSNLYKCYECAQKEQKLFADDTMLYIEINNQHNTSEILNNGLENIP